MSAPQKIDLITALYSSGILAALAYYLKVAVDHFKARSKSSSTQAILESAQIYDVLNELPYKLKCDRALVCYTSNGGGTPDAGSSLHLSALYEVVGNKEIQPVKNELQNVLLDNAFVQLLRQLLSLDTVEGSTLGLDKGVFRNLLETNNIKRYSLIVLTQSTEKFYFLVILWDDHYTDVPKQQRDLGISTAKGRIEKILRPAIRRKK